MNAALRLVICLIFALALTAFTVFCAALAVAGESDTYLGHKGHWVDAEATAYSPHDDCDAAYRAKKGADLYMTAGRVSDVRVTPYGVAAPQKGDLVLPLRTKIIVPSDTGYVAGDQELLVDDTGGTISKRTKATGRLHIDLRVKTQKEAIAFGRKQVRVFIIDKDQP